MTAVVVGLSPELAGQLALAMRHFRSSLARPNSLDLADGFAELESLFTSAARRGQTRPTLDRPKETPHDAVMDHPLLLNYVQAGHVLGFSDRKVRRLVASKELPAVRIGGAVRIRRADLEAYVAGTGTAREGAA